MKIALVAGETSGDTLGAGLVREIKRIAPHAEFEGIAGPGMCREGARTLYEMEAISIMGLDGLFKNLRKILSIRNNVYHHFCEWKPDVFVGIDVPDFNLGLECRLRRAGIPTVHYVSPTVWAWRRYRVRKIRKAVDHMLTLFPFEADFYKRHDVPVTFVGHPLADQVHVVPVQQARKQLGLSNEGEVVALLPGSRDSEITRLGGMFIQAARILLQKRSTLHFVMPCATPAIRVSLEDLLPESLGNKHFTLIDGNAQMAMQAADVALLASGTAALEAALLCTPMVVAYRVSKMSYLMVQAFSTVKHYSMPNHLLEHPIVPEYIQDDATPENLAAEVERFLDDANKREHMRRSLAGIRDQLAVGANEQAARVILDVAGKY